MSKNLKHQIHKECSTIAKAAASFRHTIHAHPEIAGEEIRTRKEILSFIGDSPFEEKPSLLETDLILDLNIGAEKTIALRADMDALPLQEETGLRHASTIPGRMHACGHDGHTAILAGAAKVIAKNKSHLKHNIRLIFQPGEEIHCMGKHLVKKGACDGVDEVYALHGWPGLTLGKIASKEGALFYAGAHFIINITGKGSHGAQPEKGLSPIVAASEIIQKLHAIHKKIEVESDSSLSVCSVQGGQNSNVIPNDVHLKGTFRFTTGGEEIRHAIDKILDVYRAKGYEIEYLQSDKYNIPVMNSKEGVEQLQSVVESHLPSDSWHLLDKGTKCSEDFAFYLKEVQNGAMFFLGLGEDTPSLHNPKFDFPDQALLNGILAMSNLAFKN